jgi:hypothetical protein
MNRVERLTELRALQRTKPVVPSEEFDAWQARVSALIGFDRDQQDKFRHVASSARMRDMGEEWYTDSMRQLETILLQAIADLEVGTDVAPEPHAEPGTAIDVFISYSTTDRAIAEDIANRLRALQLMVFLSHDTITTGPAWRSQVGVALRRCRVAVLLLSTQSLQSDWVRYEIGALWALNKAVAPALLDCDVSQLPELVCDFQARSVAGASDRAIFCHEVERLVRDTRTSDDRNAEHIYGHESQ